MAVEDARDDERGPRDRSASLVPDGDGTPDGQAPSVSDQHEPVSDEPDKRLRRARGRHTRAFLRAVADRIIETAPRVPVRDLDTLRTQFPGLGTEELADRLVAGATKGSAAVGAGVGAAAMLPVPPAMPAELAAEIVGVAGVELKLIAELHEVYGRRAPGNARERATAYLGAWASERGIEVTRPASLNTAMGGPLRRQVRQQIMRRTLRNLPNLTPFLVGAAVGAYLNRRDTAKLARRIRADLRRGPAA
ncbi:hypothetical protein FM076_25515 [Streptomyces albus subsp. chlorinus]|uniref:hypothetical protein n=1 Tax=Streptomyces albus TaxID=1888 RepID=UPI001570F20C|nr:hypothetical protein [Streptomyces albus subsp. chlorinus]